LVLQANTVVAIAKNTALRMIGLPSLRRVSARSQDGTNDSAFRSVAGARLFDGTKRPL
jgi:hypothetical protein